MRDNRFTITFASHGADLFELTRLAIVERMNGLFEVSASFSTNDPNLDFETFVGKGAALKLQEIGATKQTRVWAGLCAHIVEDGTDDVKPGERLSYYTATIRPTLWRLTLRKGNRIFQHQAIPDIVKAILTEWGITPEMKLQASYPKFEYRVQYNETDYMFVTRLLEEAGISFYFKHDGATGAGTDLTKLVLADSPQTATQRSGSLAFQDVGSAGDTPNDQITNVRYTQQLVPGAYAIRDFDFKKRPDLELFGNDKASGVETSYEVYRYIPGACIVDPGDSDAGEITSRAKKALAGARQRRRVVTFDTGTLDLAPGTVMAIGQNSDRTHPRKDLGPGNKLLIVERRLTIGARRTVDSTCAAVFADQPFYPERRTRKQRIAGVQSAIVVGPAGSEIHTDEFGRVRVQFHWDREGKYDENSSCWLRVSQGWAGTGYGMVTLPRIGHEVLVGFFDGDPDLPLVVGRVYNGTSKQGLTDPPTGDHYKLPRDAVMSGWKTDSSQGSGGYNELKFDDTKDRELIHVQGQKDVTSIIGHDQTTDIGQHRIARIKDVDETNVGEKHTISVGDGTGTIVTHDKRIVISTSDATIVLDGSDITVDAKSNINLVAGGELVLHNMALTKIDGGPMVKINTVGGTSPSVDTIEAAEDPKPTITSSPGFKPSPSAQKGAPPGQIDDVNVKRGTFS